jgi:hypothetical protein
MAGRQTLTKRWSTAVRWPVGIALTSWRYMWRTTAVHRWELDGSLSQDAPPDLPTAGQLDDVQTLTDGEGPLVHRLYRVRIVGAAMSPEELMDCIAGDLDRLAPSEFATFQKLDDEGPLSVGDEYLVRMPGP